ncbi:MAG: ribonuclease HIII [candidate division Zixibacteria bacterium]|nr:ribonuclease HIII [candidate division Zixibacteria bacterium]
MPTPISIIGVDESGKGDFFGPLVVASFLASNTDVPYLKEIGVRDGKRISQNRLLAIDTELRERFPHFILAIAPDEYNRRYQEIRNLNKLLAWGHAEAIEALVKSQDVDRAISDKFGKAELIEGELRRRKVDIDIRQLTQGEEIVQVAAASILARAAFIRAVDSLSDQYGMDIPRGAAAHVDQAGRQFVRIHGIELLDSVAKRHFKNYGRATKPDLFG